MKKKLILFAVTIILFHLASSCSLNENMSSNYILVKGGDFINKRSGFYEAKDKVADFYLGKNEISQKEWNNIMHQNPSEFKGDSLPVENVSWYDCIEFCNRKSLLEGLKPYYTVNKTIKDSKNDDDRDSLKWVVTLVEKSNGYRLPTIKEWEYASSGGQLSESYTYSGSNYIESVAWYYVNSGKTKLLTNWNWETIKNNKCKTRPTGSKASNELGFFDMSGNVREWCWDWQSNVSEEKGRAWKGGGWMGVEFCCEHSFVYYYKANAKASDLGFRICRSV